MIKVSEELLNDSVFNLESYIAREFARRIGAKEEEAFFTGDGTGKPTGIFNATGGAELGVTPSIQIRHHSRDFGSTNTALEIWKTA